MFTVCLLLIFYGLQWFNLPDPVKESKLNKEFYASRDVLFELKWSAYASMSACSCCWWNPLHLIKKIIFFPFLKDFPSCIELNCILINLNGVRSMSNRKDFWLKGWSEGFFNDFESNWKNGNKKANYTYSLLCSAARSLCRRFLNQFETLIAKFITLDSEWNDVIMVLPVLLLNQSLLPVPSFLLATGKDYVCTNLVKPILIFP